MNNFIATFFLLTLVLVSCKAPEARHPITVNSGSYLKESVARNQERIQEEITVLETVIAADSTKTYIASESGFWYAYTQKDSISNGIKPSFGDKVVFDYEISDLRGQVIYSKEELSPKQYIMDKQELISGIREALKLMQVGESMHLILPSFKGYGYYGDQNRIGVNVPLQVAITLNSLEPKIIN